MTKQPRSPPAHVPTYVILAGLLALLAWELTLAGLCMAWAGKKILDPAAQVAFVLVSLSLTVFAVIKGRHELAKIQSVRGQMLLTRWQAFLVIVLMISFGAFVTWVMSS